MVKGEVWWANLPAHPYGSEPGKRRPVLIIQSDAFNRSTIQTTICAVITSNMKLSKLPANIPLEKAVSGLDRISVVNFSQIITIDKSRLTEQVSMLPKNYIQKINTSIRYIFDTEAALT
jgi:mRNA interferase MazF